MSTIPPDVDAGKADIANDIEKLYGKPGTCPVVGDKVILQGEEYTVSHVTKAIDEKCKHDWEYVDDGEGEGPSHCRLCGLSFMRYMHCCMP